MMSSIKPKSKDRNGAAECALTSVAVETVPTIMTSCLSAASGSGRQRDPDHPGDLPGLEEEEKAGEGLERVGSFVSGAADPRLTLSSVCCASTDRQSRVGDGEEEG